MPAIYGGASPPLPGFSFGRGEALAWSDMPEAIVQIDVQHLPAFGEEAASRLMLVKLWAGDVCILSEHVVADELSVGAGRLTLNVVIGVHRLEVKTRSDDAFLYVKPVVDGRPQMEVAFALSERLRQGLTFIMTGDEELHRLAAAVRLSGKPFRASELGGAAAVSPV